MTTRTAVAGLLTSILVSLVAADGARAGRLDDAGSALREPGVWVEPELVWLLEPREARRLDRRIDRAGVPLRVAVLPQVLADESRGDPRAIARGIIRRVNRDGLYVLVDQDGRMLFAARAVPSDLSEFALSQAAGAQDEPLAERLAALVRTVQAAPPAAPVSFEPYADPKVAGDGGGPNRDPLVVIALVCALLGALAGVLLYFVVRGVAAVAGGIRQGSRV